MNKPKQPSVKSKLDELDFIMESQQLEDELRDFVMELLPLLDGVEKVCRDIDKLPADQLAGKVSALALLPEIVDSAAQTIGLARFGAAGETADARSYEIIDTRPADGAQPGTVLELIEPGWELNGVILRPARVVVAAQG